MRFNIDYSTVDKPCVVRFIAGNRHMVVKCKNLKTTTTIINKMIVAHKRNSSLKEDNLYYHFIKYVIRQKIEVVEVELLIHTDNCYELLVCEQENIDKYCHDKNFVNNTFDAYIPDFNEDKGMYGWIPRQAVLNFQRWKKNR